MKKISKHISVIILALAAIVSIWFLLNNLQPLSPALYSFAVLCIVGIVVFLRIFAPDFLQKTRTTFTRIVHYKHFTVIVLPLITLLAIFARFYFYSHFSYAPVSDPVTFYDTAQKIASGQGILGNSYPALFPYLAAYDNILGLAMKIISNPWLATLALNTTFDIGASVIMYFLVLQLTKPGSKLPFLAFAAWMLNPFAILFSVLSLPINVVNFFIVATILLTYLFIKSVIARRMTTSLGFAVLLGVILGIGNCFRPVFTVAIVAVILLCIYVIFAYKNRKQTLLIVGSSVLLVVVIFFGIQKVDLALIARETGLTPASNDSGWSIYTGSNSATNGTWNMADQNRMNIICANYKSLGDCQQKLQKAGIDRYKAYGIGGTINLFIRKLYVFSSDQSSTYNANDSLVNYVNSRTQKAMGIFITLYLIILLYLASRFLYITAKDIYVNSKAEPILLFIALLMMGFFFSDMFVETAERYAQIMYPLFMLLAVLSLQLPILRTSRAKLG